MNIIGRRKIWYFISLLVIIPGLFALIVWGLPLGIDFKGGTLIEIEGVSDISKVREIAQQNEFKDLSIAQAGQDKIIIRCAVLEKEKHENFKKVLLENFSSFQETRFETIGAAVSREITRNAILATILASVIIVFYVGWAFRKVSHPLSSWKYGVCAIVALIHDVLVVLGVFAILGHFFKIEVNSPLVTALLTVVGFSVHDTIVIFDRIRENLKKRWGTDFEQVVNDSIFEMLPRTLSTSFVIFLVLAALLIFGGETIRYFVLVLVLGVVTGTYSSIMDASPLLVSWYNFDQKRKKYKS